VFTLRLLLALASPCSSSSRTPSLRFQSCQYGLDPAWRIDRHKPASWIPDALFQPEPRAQYQTFLELGYIDAFRSPHLGETGQFTLWDYFGLAFDHNRRIRIDHFPLSPKLALV
jgi:hypothetical protein